MNEILSRDEFSKEYDKYMNGDEINEGLFQFLKSLFKDDWKGIKSNSSELKKELEKIDKSLDGYTLLKRQNFNACSQFRQALCDFANDLLENGLEELEDGKSLKKVVMGIGDDEDKVKNKVKMSPELESIVGKNSFKSKKLVEKMRDSAKNVDDIITKNPAIATWANTFKKSVKNLVNDILISKSDSDDKEAMAKAVEQKRKEDEQWLKDQMKGSYKTEQEKIKQIQKEREETFSKLDITPLRNMDSGKTIDFFKQKIEEISKGKCAQVMFGIKEGRKPTSSKFLSEIQDTLSKTGKQTGISKIFKQLIQKCGTVTEGAKNDDEKKFRKDATSIFVKFFKVLGFVHQVVESHKKELSEVTSDSIQAMYVGLMYTILFGLSDNGKIIDEDINNLDDVKKLIMRCLISSDATIGYGFPLADEKKPEAGSIYQSITFSLIDNPSKLKEYVGDSNTFTTNIGNFIKNIKNDAEKVLDKNKKEQEAIAKKLKDKEAQEK